MLFFSPKASIILFILICVGVLPVFGQHKSWRQYTTSDGLPGNEVYDMLRDSRGYMWFVTDHGICWFDGYDFKRPVDTSAFAESEAFIPTEDSKGRIWFNRIDQSLWMIDHDTVQAWEYNNIINQYKGKFQLIDQIGIEENGTVWLGMTSLGFLVVEKNGKHRVVRNSINQNLQFRQVRNKLVFAFQDYDPILYVTKGKEVQDLLFQDGDQTMLIDQYRRPNHRNINMGAWYLQHEDILTYYNGIYTLIQDKKLTFKVSSDIDAEKAIQTNEGHLLLASHSGSHTGLFYYASLAHFKRGEVEVFLKKYLVTDIYCDPEGGWWATTRNGGVFYCKNPEIDIYDEASGFSSSDVMRVSNDQQEKIFAGLGSKEVVEIDRINGRVNSISSPGLVDTWTSLFFEPSHHRLWCSSVLKYLDKNQWKLFQWDNNFSHLKNPVDAKEISLDPKGGKMWMSSSHGFYSLDIRSSEINYHIEADTSISQGRTFSVVADRQGNIWVATVHGLRIWIEDHYEMPPFDHTAMRTPARDLAILNDDGLAMAFGGRGILIRYPDNKLLHFTKEDGLSSDDINLLKISPDNNIYACTNEGLSVLVRLDNGTWKIKNIGIEQGLPSNVVHDVTFIGGQIWLGTNKGLVRLKNVPESLPIPKPQIEKFLVNNKRIVYTPNIHLPFDENNVTIRFSSLHFRSEGKINYRYRLNIADTAYQFTSRREVNFPKLAPGKYSFEVQAQNEDYTWSLSAIVPFEIRPPVWLRWWFIALLSLLIIGIVTIIIRNYLKQLRNKIEISNKIKDLEMAALRAQMNPHFIFNCLGSIQQFIVENDSPSATRYLSRFAKLVRLALHSSVDGRHSLSEEIEMLDNYLALEQLRFKGRFDYSISQTEVQDPDDVYLPPMLVQPFVENAVVHGVKNKIDHGEIHIEFRKKESTLEVTVTDNGPGFSSDSIRDDNGHKSVGMTLTSHRLEILSGIKERSNYNRENITNLKGDVKGSRVIIRIPVD